MPEVFVKHHPEKEEEEGKDPIRTLLTWTAPSRPFRKKDRSYYTTIAILVILLTLILILANEYLLIGVVLSVAFVAYVLGFVAPEDINYKISTQGITISDHFYFWQDLDSFWFKEKENQRLIYINTRLRFPAQLMMVLGSIEEETIKKIVAKYLPFQEIPPKNLLDSWSESLVKHFPLENPHK